MVLKKYRCGVEIKVKVTVFFILILVSLNSFSEEYVCSVSYSGDDNLEIKTYERRGGVFKKTSEFGMENFQITNETEEFIILTQIQSFPAIFTVFLDKKNKNIVEDYVEFDDPDSLYRITGKCIIKN